MSSSSETSDYLPDFPYGAVYYRVSNPPAKDWERDYATAAEDGTSISPPVTE